MTKPRLIVFAVAVIATIIALGSIVDAAIDRFSDVPEDHYAATEIAWAADHGIIFGCGDGTKFCPDDTLTRAHLAAMLHRYHQAASCLHAPIEHIQFPGTPTHSRRLAPGVYVVEVIWDHAVQYAEGVKVSARNRNLVYLTGDAGRTLLGGEDSTAAPWDDLDKLVVASDPDPGQVRAGEVSFRISGVNTGDDVARGIITVTRDCSIGPR